MVAPLSGQASASPCPADPSRQAGSRAGHVPGLTMGDQDGRGACRGAEPRSQCPLGMAARHLDVQVSGDSPPREVQVTVQCPTAPLSAATLPMNSSALELPP